MTDLVISETVDQILTVTLNRPEKLNAINLAMSDALEGAVDTFVRDEHLRVLVITANGRYFCAGADTGADDFHARRGREGVAHTRMASRRLERARYHDLHDRLEAVEKPVVFAINGGCLGLGLEMAVSGDFRLCSTSARFGLPEVRHLGVIAASGGTSRLTRIVGPHWSKWIGMACQVVDADAALRMGLVHEVCPDDALQDRTREFALDLVSMSADGLALAKTAIDLCTAQDRDKGRYIERLSSTAAGPDPFETRHGDPDS